MAICTGQRCPMQVGYPVEQCEHTDCPYRTKPQTNADRIRAMSDEELARFLAENEWECETYNDCAKCPRMTDDGCVSLSKWLKQPADMRGEEE